MNRSPLLPPDSLVFDLGANHGEVSKLLLEAGAGKVVAVEACQEIFVELYKVPGIIPIHAAVWGTETIIEASYCAYNDGGWSSCMPDKWIKTVPEAKFEKPQWVPTVTLDGLIRIFGVPQLIKIDIEGAELTALKGLSTKVNYLMFEFNRAYHYDALAILAFLRAHFGYTMASYVCGNLDLETVPTTPILDVAANWHTADPHWGMFTVS